MCRYVHWRSSRHTRWLAVASLALLLTLQACGGNNNFTTHQTKNTHSIGISNATFDGKLMFVVDGNIFILNGSNDSLTQVTSDGSDFQPSLSHNGKTLAFEVRQAGNDYSDLATMPLSGGSVALHTDNRLLCRCDPDKSGVYHYEFWAANPIWSSDDQQLIYLSDFYKGGRATPIVNQTCIGNAEVDSIQDLGIVEIPANTQPLPAVPPSSYHFNSPKLLAWPYCYAGGDQDLSLRPGVSDTEILFTSFQYPPSNTSVLVAQISVLIIPNDGSPERIIQLSPKDPSAIPLEPSWSSDGKYITYIRRENGQDNLYIMPVDATITGTPNDESYRLIGGGTSVYYTNTDYYMKSQLLASGTIGQPVWGSNHTLFFTMYNNGEFNLYMAAVKFSSPPAAPTTAPGATPTTGGPSMPIITLDGSPAQLTTGGIDATSRPVWLST